MDSERAIALRIGEIIQFVDKTHKEVFVKIYVDAMARQRKTNRQPKLNTNEIYRAIGMDTGDIDIPPACPDCGSEIYVKAGIVTVRAGKVQRYRCTQCNRVYRDAKIIT
jgi:DNA-directed RNA polymerase subunit RPC12/RpoP